MDREIQFAKALEKVKKLGRLQGNSIRKEQVREAFAELSLDEAQLALVYDYLEKHQIGVDKKAEAQTVLSEEETDYLQETGGDLFAEGAGDGKDLCRSGRVSGGPDRSGERGAQRRRLDAGGVGERGGCRGDAGVAYHGCDGEADRGERGEPQR